MKKLITKTTTDLWLENYFKQEKITFTYEPFAKKSGQKSPDYLITKANKRILIENKEIEKMPLDTTTTGVQTSDPRIYFSLLRSRIDKAAEQLKPYRDQVDYCVVILGKVSGFAISPTRDLFFAMFGDPVIRVPINLKSGKRTAKPYADLTMTGSLIKFKGLVGL